MKKLILLLYLLFAGMFYAFSTISDVQRELLRQLEVAGHDTLRLNILDELVGINKQQPEARAYYAGELLKEAEWQKNSTFQCKAYLYFVFIEFNKRNIRAVKSWMQKLELLARRGKLYDIMWQGQQCYIELLVLDEEYELVERETQKMLKEAENLNSVYGQIIADICLAGIYQTTFRGQEATEALEHAFALSSKIDNELTTTEIISYLIAHYRNMENNSQWLKYLKIKESWIKSLIKKHPQRKNALKGDLLMIYLSYMRYYALQNRLDLAGQYKQLADKYYIDEYVAYRFSYYMELAVYYQVMGELENASEALDRVLGILKGRSKKDYCAALFMKGELLGKMGRYEEALGIEKELLLAKDSLRITVYNKQIGQLNESYSIDSALLMRSRIQSWFKLVVLGVIVLLIAILLYFALRFYYIQRCLNKSEKKIRKIAEDVNRAVRVKERFLTNMSYAIRMPLGEVVRHSLLLASDEPMDEARREKIVHIISDSSTQLIALVNNILDLSRLEAGKMKFSVSEIDVKYLIQDVIGRAAVKDIQFNSAIPEYGKVNIDGMQLRQILDSLLVLADGAVFLRINLEQSGGKFFVVTVTNSALASVEPTQEMIIRNEINRMIIEYFGGQYEVRSGFIRFTLKI